MACTFFILVLRMAVHLCTAADVPTPSIFPEVAGLTFLVCTWLSMARARPGLEPIAMDLVAETSCSSRSSRHATTWSTAPERILITKGAEPVCSMVRSSTYWDSTTVGKPLVLDMRSSQVSVRRQQSSSQANPEPAVMPRTAWTGLETAPSMEMTLIMR